MLTLNSGVARTSPLLGHCMGILYVRAHFPARSAGAYRPYAIDVITQITKRETDGGRKFGYYAAILSGKKGRGLRSLSTAEHFASSFPTSAGSDFTSTPGMR